MKILLSGYGAPKKTSIGRYDVNLNTGEIEELFSAKIKNSSYMCAYDDLLFCISEKPRTSSIHMFRAHEGSYKILDSMDIDGSGLCHITYLANHQALVGSCYGDGVLFSVKVEENKFGGYLSKIQLAANSEGVSRAHCARATTDESLLFATNIADDMVYMYEINDGKLLEKCTINLTKGEGPRHIYIDDTNKILYIITEYSNLIISISYDKNKMEEVSSISTLPLDFTDTSYCSALCVSRDKKYLYAANRGANLIAIFKIDAQGGLKLREFSSCNGDWPRDIFLTNDDKYLIVANERSNKAVFLKRDCITGLLLDKVNEIKFTKPSCILQEK